MSMSSTNENLAVGERLRHLRESNNLTQPAFADALGISLRGYQNYERGERGPSDLLIRAVWRTLGADPLWLLTGEGPIYRRAKGESPPPPPPSSKRRVEALVAMLDQLPEEDRDAILSAAIARASDRKQLAELRQAIAEIKTRVS